MSLNRRWINEDGFASETLLKKSKKILFSVNKFNSRNQVLYTSVSLIVKLIAFTWKSTNFSNLE